MGYVLEARIKERWRTCFAMIAVEADEGAVEVERKERVSPATLQIRRAGRACSRELRLRNNGKLTLCCRRSARKE